MAEVAFGPVGDDAFGPQLWPQFDFTLLFEHAILTVLPAGLLIAASLFYLFYYFRSPVYVSGSILLWAKLAVSAALLGIEIAGLVLWNVLPAHRTDASLAAASLACIGSVCIVIVVNLQHRHSLQSSAFISLFLGLTSLLDIAKARSQLSRPGLTVIGGLSVAAATVKFLLLMLEEIPKRRYIKDPILRSSLSRETTSGFWNRSFFVWLNSTLFLGFRNILTVEKLGNLDHEFSSENLSAKFEPIWAKSSYNHFNYRLTTRLRGVLVSEIFKKTLAIEQVNAKEFAAATLMSTDIDGISEGLPKFHELWASFLELGLGLYFLSTAVGAAAFLIIFPAIVSTLAGLILGSRMAPARAAWNNEIQGRVSITAGVLQQLKSIKMMGLKSTVADLVQGLRESEMKLSKTFRLLYVIQRATVMLCYQMTPVVVITAALFWTKLSGGLGSVQTYTTLAFLVLTALPLIKIMLSYTTITTTLACFQRIQTYLLLNELQDRRETISDLVLRASGDDENSHAEKCPAEPFNKPSIELMLPQPPILFADASIAATSGGEPKLKKVNLSITRSELAVVLGHTGSGKSTFLRAILGEATVTNGLVYAEQRHIAYCDQSPWLRDITIQENILGDNILRDSKYDRDWYETVLDACLLTDDIRHLPNGDQSKAGAGGANLSGGQRQRVALARAIYSQASIFVLDNVFSALDKTTSDAVFHRLLGPNGLLRRISKTVVMTTHRGIVAQPRFWECHDCNKSSSLVEYINAADRILVINDDGSVESISNLRQIDVRDLVPAQPHELNIDDAGLVEDVEKSDMTNASSSGDDHLVRKQGDMGLYSFYLKSVSKWLWIIFLVAVIIVTVSQRLPGSSPADNIFTSTQLIENAEIFIRIWLDVAPENKVYIVGYILLSLSCFIFTLITLGLFYLRMVPESSETLHRKLLDTVMGFSQDMSLLSQDLPIQFFLFLWAAVLLLTDMGIVASGATYVATTIPFLLIVLYLIQYFYLRTSRQMRYLDLEAKTPLYTQFTEITSGLSHIRSFGWRARCQAQSLNLLDYSQKPFYYMYCIQRWLGLVTDLCVLGVATILVSIALCVKGTTSQNALGLALLNVMQFGDSTRSVIEFWVSLETSLGAIARLRTFIQETPTERDSSADLPAGCLKRGGVELIDVTSTYNSTSAVPKAALDKVSLEIKPGQKVAVTGRTGSGKSSFILTLLKFLDYTGVIKFDGVDLSNIPRQELRSMITTIPQDLVELPGTVRDNLLPVTRIKAERNTTHVGVLFEVLARVGLLDYIDSHGGLDAPLVTMGFSHGQKQLLAIARAMLHKLEHDNKILLVDEATSNIDSRTAAVMHRALEDAFLDCTVISISHRPENIEKADVVVTIQDGRIVSVVKK
ncbi:hypothetical protein QQS21_009499 [Conoideocrella luteorostrata]|uniref:Uncharacterized protein n=1 Tax=Conoideocrella luteorostrata TaxID=1105319 RepID=A0AAJ0CH34_9HYPO|nr:hypothetical protein QQS21_009499 [Conoideocrella luteorostrata]